MTTQCPKCKAENPDTQKFCGECATPLQLSKDIGVTKTFETPIEEYQRGSTFAERYKIIEKLGMGGMGAVYRVEDTNIGQDIALKLIKSDIASDKKTIERFRNELKTTRMISHRNVCRMFDLSETSGTYFITMEYVSGEDLKSFIRRSGKLDIPKAISIAKEICEGLSEAHRLGVVHRDLKSNNIMINKDGNARIMDFGIARSLRTKGLTGEGIIIGTPEYMSPEQAEAKQVDHRSDIYSLGVILYEMVTGRLPFEAETPLAIAMKHKSEMAEPPKDYNALIPNDLNGIIMRCLAKEKENRFQDVENLQSELIKLEDGIPITERTAPIRKPLTSRDITVQFNLRKLFIPALIVAVVLTAAFVIYKLLPKKVDTHPSSDKPSLAVMYFENNTGDQSLDHWRKALSELLSADLSQSKRLRVLGGDRLFKILSQLNQLEAKSYSSDILADVASKGGVANIVRGSFSKAGETYRINIMLQDANSGELLGSEKVEGQGEASFFVMVDELTRRIKTNFLLSAEEIASDIDKDVGKITTSSPEAYKYYSEGMRLYNKGEYRPSIEFMEKALEADPEFAMAYRSMAWSYDDLKFRDLGRTYLQKALEFSERLSDRERLLIQGNFYHRSFRENKRALEVYKQLLQLYPEDQTGIVSLAQFYNSMELWDEIIGLCEVNRKNKDDNVQTYNLLAIAYQAKGLYDKSTEILENYLMDFPDNAHIHEDLAMDYLCQGKMELALLEVDKAFSLDPDFWQNFRTKGHIHLTQGDLVLAEKEYQKILEIEEEAQHQWGMTWLGSLYLLQGKFEKSLNQLERALALSKKLGEKGSESGFYTRLAYTYLKSGDYEKALEESKKGEKSSLEERGCMLCHQNWALLYKGLAQIEKNSLEDAQTTADELKELTQKELNKNYMRLYYHLIGMKELAEENFPAAIDYFTSAVSLLSYQNLVDNLNDQAFFIEPLAYTYYKTGELEKAQEMYEQIISMSVGRLHWGYEFAKSFYMLGIIYEQKGWEGKAIDHYEKFLDLWKDADPGIAEIDDARERLARLKQLP